MEDNFENENTNTDNTETGSETTETNPVEGQENGSSEQTQQQDLTNSFDIPEEYKEKDWAKNFEGKTGDELKNEVFKTLDDKYSNAPQIPEKAEDYALQEVEFKDEEGNTTYEYPQDVLEHFSDVFKDKGVTKEQAQGLLQDYTKFELEQFQALTDIDELNNSIDEMFKSNPAQKTQVQGLLKEFLPAEDQQFLNDTAPNYVIQMFYKVAKGLQDKYGYKEGTGGQGSQNNYRMTQEDKDKEYEKICNEMEDLQRRPHTTEEKEALQKKLNALFQ